jgi:hypothetical protein
MTLTATHLQFPSRGHASKISVSVSSTLSEHHLNPYRPQQQNRLFLAFPKAFRSLRTHNV